MLAGCAGSPVPPTAASPGECPDSLESDVRLTASVAQVSVPNGLQTSSGPVRLVAGLGRRVILSVEVPSGLPRVRLLANSLSIYTFGGILGGWARVVRPAGAGARESMQVSDDLLRVAPFITGPKLHTHTQTIDMLVVPGGAPAGAVALRPGPMWDDAGRPIAPDELKIVLDPILHMTVLDTVSATATFEFRVVHRSGAHELWECSARSNFQLVDHDSVLPNLWILQTREGIGRKPATLALYDRSVGAFPIVLLDPATAAGFARWLSETRASRAGEYAIGTMTTANARAFQHLADDELAGLKVRQLGD
jgi:hypothetical protein